MLQKTLVIQNYFSTLLSDTDTLQKFKWVYSKKRKNCVVNYLKEKRRGYGKYFYILFRQIE